MKKIFKSGQNPLLKKMAKKNSDIQGYVERIEDLQVEGWVLSLEKNAISLFISIDNVVHPVRALWHERSDVAGQFGDAYLKCGFTFAIPDNLTDIFLAACRNGRAIVVLANDTPLVSKVDPSHLKTLASAPKSSKDSRGASTQLGKTTTFPAMLMAELANELSEELFEYLAEEFFADLPRELAEYLSFDNSLGEFLEASQEDLPEELFEGLPAELSRELSVLINTSPVLRNILTYKEKLDKIIGYVEEMEPVKIRGWLIRTDQKTVNLELAIDGKIYPVEPVWIVRSDVASQFGDDFLNSGFEILVPTAAIDEFLDAFAEDKPIDVLADGIKLQRSFKARVLAKEKEADDKEADSDEAEERPIFRFKDIADINAKFGVDISSEDFHKLLAGQTSYPIRMSENDSLNASYYFEWAIRNLKQHRAGEGRSLLKICLAFEKRAEFWEMLGNGYMDLGDFETANCHYEAALASPGRVSKWLFSNLEHCKKRLAQPKDIVKTLLDGIACMPDVGMFRDRFDDVMQEFWLKQQGALEVLVVDNDRSGLVAKMAEVSSFIYNAYLRFYGATENPRWVGSCNLERILIVGDFHIPQCVRYRIDQKVEQLEEAGKEVTTVSWTELASSQNILAFHDVVIFYRVPAEVQVLKAMAQVNATGKLSLYEIDDLLFDPAYPPALETYGGYLDLNLYLQILKGMGSFNAAARYCRFGLASTLPLAEQLQSMVFGGRCFLHRNGLDSLNLFKSKLNDPGKTTLDIFYGSGTMAHNSDFIDLVLPAIARILDEHPETVLVIAGYLKLPAQFKEQYVKRIKQLPPVKSIKAYWSMLEHADINLAVLHDDFINGCKSELKWFEAACLGIPSVLSTTANYRDVIKEGEDGLLAASGDDWYRQLKLLVEQPDVRRRIAEAAQLRVREEYSIPVLAENISRVLAEALAAAQNNDLPTRRKLSLVNVFFPPQSIGGATRVVADNFERLQSDYADRFEITVFTTQAEHKHPYIMDAYNYEGARVYRVTSLWREHMDWHSQDQYMGELFAEYLEAERPDLIHFHCIQRLSGSIIEAAQKAEVPYIVTVHDAWWISDYQFLVDAKNKVYPEGHPDIYEERKPPANISQEASIERTLYLKELLRGAEKVLTVSNCFADIYRKNGIPQILVNKNGVSEAIRWQPKNTGNKPKVVCGHVGGMAEHKGYFLLKAAVKSLQPKNIEFLVVDHNHDDSYRKQALWGKVPVTFIGRIRQENIVDLYSQIDVLMAPSKWPESYGLVTREAAACGCWVVASSLGGIGEDVVEGKSGFVVEPTLNALVACLTKIDNNPEQFKGLAETQQLRSVTEQVNELVDYYDAVTTKIDS